MGRTDGKISFFTQILLIVLLLGAGTDYGLFLVFRVREELTQGREVHDAVAHAMARVGESITASAATVIVALLTLLLASFGIYHDLGIPLAIGIFVMLLAGLTLLPALLAILGRAVFWPFRPATGTAREGLWGRAATRLLRRPALTLGVGVACLVLLALCALGYKAGSFGGSTTAPAGTKAAAGNAAVAKHFPQSTVNPTNVVMQFPNPVWDDPAALDKATAELGATGDFTKISGPLNANGSTLTGAQLAQLHQELGASPQELAATAPQAPADSPVPADLYNAYVATSHFLSEDGRTAAWYVDLKAGNAQSTEATQAIPGIRERVDQAATRGGGDGQRGGRRGFRALRRLEHLGERPEAHHPDRRARHRDRLADRAAERDRAALPDRLGGPLVPGLARPRRADLHRRDG